MTNTATSTAPPTLQHGLIPKVVDLVGTALAETDDNTAIGIREQGTDVELLVRQLPDGSPEALLGFVAPDDWVAFGMCVTGHTTPLGHDEVVSEDPHETRILLIADRHGNHLARFHVGGELRSESGDAAGPLVDLCLRVLQRPTPKSAQSTMYLWAVLWLDRIVADFASAGTPPDWRQITPLCPGIELGREVFGARPTADQIATLGRCLTAGYDWEALRNLQATGHGLLPEPDADVADWMDEGMFARRVLACLPDLEDLVEATDALAGRGARSALSKVLRAWDILPHPDEEPASPT